MAIEVKLELFHDECPYITLSKEIPKKTFTTQCNDYFDLFIFPGGVNEFIYGLITKNFPRRKLSLIDSQNKEYGYVILDCGESSNYELTEHVPSVIIGHNNGLRIGPMSFYNGTESFKFVVFSNSDLKRVLTQFKIQNIEVKILSINEVEKRSIDEDLDIQGIPVSHFERTMTTKQRDTFITAYRRGYYEIPRKVKLETMADEAGVSRHAVEKLIRAVEKSIMDILGPLLDPHYYADNCNGQKKVIK